MSSIKLLRILQTHLILAIVSFTSAAQAQSSVYRCGGSPVIYTSDQRWAKEQGCALLGSPNESYKQSRPVQRRSPNLVSAATSTTLQKTTPVVPKSTSAIYGSTEQKARDSDQLSILNNELRNEKTRLEALTQKLPKDITAPNSGVESELKKSIARSQSDIVALEREIARMR